jgi:hypothetical protein
MKYFRDFPTVTYNNYIAKNLLTRVDIPEDIRRNFSLFYSHTLKETQRLDVIAHQYYDDAENDWAIMLANDIIDPYYEYPLNAIDFDNYIVNKYGSLQKAIQKILYYRNNYVEDDESLTISGYNALPAYLKKYWRPDTGYNNQVSNYVRDEKDWTVNTNKILELQITLVDANNTFAILDRVTQNDAIAEVTAANSSVIHIQHVEGDFLANSIITSSYTNASANVTSVSELSYSFENTAEENYWSKVTAHDYELERNEKLKHLVLLDKNYQTQLEKKFREALR